MEPGATHAEPSVAPGNDVNPSVESPPAASKTASAGKEFWSERCAIHGIQEALFAQNLPTKTFWALAFAFALCMAIYGCVAIILEYVRSPVVVSYFVQENDSVALPDVVVCPFNRFNSSYLKQYNVSEELSDYIQLAYGFTTPYAFSSEYVMQSFHQNNASFYRLADQLDSLLLQLNKTFKEFVYEASLSCDGILSNCIFAHDKKNCCSIAVPLMTSVGKCYRIPGFKQEAAGYGFGMTITVNLSRHLFTPAANNLHNDGIAVKLAERGKGIDFDLTFIPTGAHALMALKTTLYDFINDPPRYECGSAHGANYSRLDCFGECVFEAGHRVCNCAHVAGNSKSIAEACGTRQFRDCLIRVTREAYMANPSMFLDCRKKCRSSCKYWQYIPSLSYAKFPSPTMKNYLESEAEWKSYDDLIILDVFYENLEFALIKHFPRMTADTFIANIGGQMGLWLGGSILTILQIIVFLTQIGFDWLIDGHGAKRTLNKSRNQSVVSTIPLPQQNEHGADLKQSNVATYSIGEKAIAYLICRSCNGCSIRSCELVSVDNVACYHITEYKPKKEPTRLNSNEVKAEELVTPRAEDKSSRSISAREQFFLG